MKTQYIVLSFLFLFATSFAVQGQKAFLSSVKKESIKVWGECGMCKKRIENASRNAGAVTADWNEDNKMLSVSYNQSKTNISKIQQAVAAAGYDTRDITATAETYNNLPGCCHYQRKEIAKQVSLNCCKDETACTKDAACCNSKEEKCNKDNGICKDMPVCKEKTCCKS